MALSADELNKNALQHLFIEPLYFIPEALQVSHTENTERSANEPAKEPSEKEVAQLPINYIGGNEKKVLVVVNMLPEEYASIHKNPFLTRILAAIQLTLQDVAIVNYTQEITSLENIASQIPFTNAIIFLAPNHSLIQGLRLAPYQPMQVMGKWVIACADIKAIQADTQLKARLWTGLKAIFL